MLHTELEERLQRLEAALQSNVQLANVHHKMQLLESNPSVRSPYRSSRERQPYEFSSSRSSSR